MRGQVGVGGGGHHSGQHHLGEAPGYGGGDAGLGDVRGIHRQRRAGQLGFQRRVGCGQLALHAVQPRGVQLFGRAQLVLVHGLHRFFAGGQGQAQHAQCLAAGGGVGGHQRAGQGRAGQRGQVVQDEGGIHQHRAVVRHQRGGFDQRVDGRKSVKVPEHRHGPVLERNAQQPQRNGHAAHIG